MKLKENLSKYQNYLLGIALLLSSVAISIRSSDGKIHLVLHQYPALIFLLILFSSFFVALYFQTNQWKIEKLSEEIQELSKNNTHEFDVELNELTERQRQVFDLIIQGKTNKEIMSSLFIEQSTLKSHINQIYAKLNIKSRRELKSKLKE